MSSNPINKGSDIQKGSDLPISALLLIRQKRRESGWENESDMLILSALCHELVDLRNYAELLEERLSEDAL